MLEGRHFRCLQLESKNVPRYTTGLGEREEVEQGESVLPRIVRTSTVSDYG